MALRLDERVDLTPPSPSLLTSLFGSPDLDSAYLKFLVYRPSPEPRRPMNIITVPTKTTAPEPMLEHAIRQRAYDLYAQRGMAEGHAVDDWLAAESELQYANWPLYDLNQKSKR